MFSSRQKNRRYKQRARVTSSRSKRGAKNRRNKAGLWDTIKTANKRAHQRSNKRSYSRKGLRSVKASISDGVIDDYRLPTAQLIIRTLIGLLLLFPCFISTIALFQIDGLDHASTTYWSQLFFSQPHSFLYFAVGIFLMLGWFYSGLFNGLFLYFYVLGHELTHAFFIYLCGGRISEFKVTKQGGHVVTNKTNILIALSPYFVPFWSVVILAISLLLEIFTTIPYHNQILYLLIGVSWTFHLCWTLWMIPRDQPDLKENGSFFSLTIIYLANVLLLASMLCLAPNGFSFTTYCYQWLNLASENASSIKQWLFSFL